jgi:3-oxoacyl-[acyl-carrier-protein] synthase II
VQIAAEVKEFDATTIMDAKVARQSSRFVQFTASAARQAIQASGIDLSQDPDRNGCIIGVGLGAFGEIESDAHVFKEKGPRRVSPLLLPYAIPNMAAGFVSIAEGLRGPSFCTATACASGTHAIGEAYMHIAIGTADVIVTGGAEAAISPLSVASFAQMRALSTCNDAPQVASRPFDLNRDGFVMGEGAGILVLEEFEQAKRRGAPILAEIIGYGMSADAYHITMPPPEGQGMARCLAATLRSAAIPPESVDYINAHGTSTSANDVLESAAIEVVFGDHARKLSVSSTKGVTGHCLGAAGGIEAAYTVLAIQRGIVPPTANLHTPDPKCRLDYTPNTPRDRKIQIALSNSCGFGGQNACVAFRKC